MAPILVCYRAILDYGPAFYLCRAGGRESHGCDVYCSTRSMELTILLISARWSLLYIVSHHTRLLCVHHHSKSLQMDLTPENSGGFTKNLAPALRHVFSFILQGTLENCDRATTMQLCYEFKTFLLAGHETSAAMLTWTLFELSRSPEKLSRVDNSPPPPLLDIKFVDRLCDLLCTSPYLLCRAKLQ